MPSLVRFLIAIAVLAALVYGAMLALVAFVEPVPRPMEQAVPAAKLNPPKGGTAGVTGTTGTAARAGAP